MTTTAANTVHLQSLGTVPAVRLADVQVGDRLMWNQGQTSTVTAIRFVTKSTVELTQDCSGTLVTSRKRAATLVARVA